MSYLIFFLLLTSALRNDTASQKAPECKNVSCFGAADCKILHNNTKCVTVIQNISLDDVIKLNLNISDDDVFSNQTMGLNSTCSTRLSSFSIMITVLFTRV